jgi:hypothetical protein
MKRSECLTILIEVLNTTDHTFADRVLKALEEAGVYPPCRRDGKYDWEAEDSVPKMSPTRSITDGNQDS